MTGEYVTASKETQVADILRDIRASQRPHDAISYIYIVAGEEKLLLGVVDLRNLVLAYDLLDFAQERYMSMSPNDIWVPGARAAEFDDAEMIAALPDSPFREQIPGVLREAHKLLFNPKVRPQP